MNFHDDLYRGVISKMATRWKQKNYCNDIHLPAIFKMPARWQQRIIFMTSIAVLFSRYTRNGCCKKKLVNDMHLGVIF